MVRQAQLSIAGLMGIVLVASLGLTALRLGNEEWAGATMLVTCGMLSLGVMGAVCRGKMERAWWLGFALFGWGYLLLVFMEPYTSLHIPTSTLLENLRPPSVQVGGRSFRRMSLFSYSYLPPAFSFSPYSQAGHSLFSLVFAAMGGLLTVWLFGRRSAGTETAVGPVTKARSLRRWSRWLVVIASVAMIAGLAVVLAGLRWAPGLLCTATMFVTWGLLGLAIVGTVYHAGRSRAVWLGAALFGIGYMTLIFGRDPDRPTWPWAGTDLLLRALRPSWYVNENPPPVTSTVLTNAWIRGVLERPIPMRYPNDTPWGDVLQAIQEATRSPNGRGLVFYVDPIGLQEAEKTMQSPITIDIENVPLRTTLRLILKQLDLRYGIQDGMVYITSDPHDEDLPSATDMDPYLSIGHSLLALIAAGLGAVLARWFCAPREEPAAQPMSI